MNKLRRKNLEKLIESIEEIRADLETICEEEEEARDNIPESMQESEKYERADEACENLNSAIECFEELVDYIQSAIDA